MQATTSAHISATQAQKPPAKDKSYVSQTSRCVSKQIAQALDMENLNKMDAVDILSVLKRIENLEKMAQTKSKKQGRQAALSATTESGSGGSVPNPAAALESEEGNQ